MAMSERERRTEPATPRRLAEARARGQVPRTPDLSPALGLIGLAVAFFLLTTEGPGLVSGLTALWTLPAAPPPLTADGAVALFGGMWDVARPVALTVLPALAGLTLAGLVAAQGIALAAPRLSLAALNPLTGLAQMFSARQWTQLALSAVKVALAVATGTVILSGALSAWAASPPTTVVGAFGRFAQIGDELLLALAGEAGLIGGISVLLARRRYAQDLRMTREELREEMRRHEGDPLARRRRRQTHRRLLSQRLVPAIRAADVVVTNPTHYAVALRYEPTRRPAPEVLAKGADHVAQTMRRLAAEHDVPVVADPPLARALYRDVAVGQVIPARLYAAMAEVLAAVYRARGTWRRAGGGVR